MHGTGMRYDNKTAQVQVFAAPDVKISGQDTPRRSRSTDNENNQP